MRPFDARVEVGATGDDFHPAPGDPGREFRDAFGHRVVLDGDEHLADHRGAEQRIKHPGDHGPALNVDQAIAPARRDLCQ